MLKKGIDLAAIGTALSAFFDAIQGPLAAVASLLSAIWLTIQIAGWAARMWREHSLWQPSRPVHRPGEGEKL